MTCRNLSMVTEGTVCRQKSCTEALVNIIVARDSLMRDHRDLYCCHHTHLETCEVRSTLWSRHL